MGPTSRMGPVMPAPEEYFRGVSPLCRRILDDMARVRRQFGDKWNTLSYADQCKILDQTIVDEATVRMYEKRQRDIDCEYFPKLKISTGQKIVSDEKLSARGYNCSWRDEHSAPFSWHTRSQMDLSASALPETPLETEADRAVGLGEGDDGGRIAASNSFVGPAEAKVKTAAFFWHYDPRPWTDAEPQDPPDLVVHASLIDSTRPGDSNPRLLAPRGAAFNHVVVRGGRDSSGGGGLGSWLRGALEFVTGSCAPLHRLGGSEKSAALHPGSPFIHPELRPPHVIAKAARVAFPTLAQPKRRRGRGDDTPSESTHHVPSVDRDSNARLSPPSEPDPLLFEPPAEELASDQTYEDHILEDSPADETHSPHRTDSSNPHEPLLSEATNPRPNAVELREITEAAAAIARTKARNLAASDHDHESSALLVPPPKDQDCIPKTGFDFLDNW